MRLYLTDKKCAAPTFLKRILKMNNPAIQHQDEVHFTGMNADDMREAAEFNLPASARAKLSALEADRAFTSAQRLASATSATH
jgi:hypothetical protein